MLLERKISLNQYFLPGTVPEVELESSVTLPPLSSAGLQGVQSLKYAGVPQDVHPRLAEDVA